MVSVLTLWLVKSNQGELVKGRKGIKWDFFRQNGLFTPEPTRGGLAKIKLPTSPARQQRGCLRIHASRFAVFIPITFSSSCGWIFQKVDENVEVLVPVQILQFQHMLNENRFLGTLRDKQQTNYGF